MSVAPRNYELLIFDWDGTLSDSEALIVGTMQKAIAGLDLPPRSDQQIRVLIGLGLNEGLQILYPEIPVQQLRALLDGYRSNWLRSVSISEAPLFEDAQAALDQLHVQGYRLSVATGKSRAGLNRSLAALPQVSRLMELTRCADETASKPDPMMLREILQESGVAAESALVIGDTEYDMEMARGAGVAAVGVACGVHDSARIRAAGALAVLDNAAALPTWLAARARQRQ